MFAKLLQSVRLCGSQRLVIFTNQGNIRTEIARLHRWIANPEWVGLAEECSGWDESRSLQGLRRALAQLEKQPALASLGHAEGPHCQHWEA